MAKTAADRHIFRILELPGFRSAEDRRILEQPAKGPLTPEFEAMVDELSVRTFGIAKSDTEWSPPEDYWDLDEDDPKRLEINAQWDAQDEVYQVDELPYDSKIERLLNLGWDFTDERGNLLQITELFSRQAEAVSAGVAGHLPAVETIGLDSWTARIEQDVRLFKRGGQQTDKSKV